MSYNNFNFRSRVCMAVWRQRARQRPQLTRRRETVHVMAEYVAELAASLWRFQHFPRLRRDSAAYLSGSAAISTRFRDSVHFAPPFHRRDTDHQ